jgi:hypothetical protein
VTPATSVPTFAEIIPAVRATPEAGTRRTYGTHLNRLEQDWGHLRSDGITKPDLEVMAHTIRTTARTDRASRGGTSAADRAASPRRRSRRYRVDSERGLHDQQGASACGRGPP